MSSPFLLNLNQFNHQHRAVDYVLARFTYSGRVRVPVGVGKA